MKKNQFLLYLLFISASCNDDNIIINKEILIGKNDTLYLFTKNWGLTSDKQITELSSTDFVSNDLLFDTTASYVYKGLEPFSYKLKNDTLFIYMTSTYKAPVPNKFSSPIVVIQKTTEDEDYIDIRSIHDSTRIEYKFPGSTIKRPNVPGEPVPKPS